MALSEAFRSHLKKIMESDARNLEVQNRFDALVARDGAATAQLAPNVSFSGNEANPFFYNRGGQLVEIGTTLGLSRREDGRGFVLTDLDGDGALDVVIHNYYTRPLVALLNRAAGGNRWLRVRLRGTASNRFGIGARVKVNGRVRELHCGTGYMTGNAPELHFGLGRAERADVEVLWPSGRRQKFRGVAADRVVTLSEDSAEPAVAPLRRADVAAAEAPREAPPPVDVRRALQEAGVEGERVVAVFFRISCYACRGELLRHQESEAAAARAGVRLVWLSADADPGHVDRWGQANGVSLACARPKTLPAGLEVPSAYLVLPDRVERFLGRHAVAAALEAAR